MYQNIIDLDVYPCRKESRKTCLPKGEKMEEYMVLSYFDMNDAHFPGYKNLCWQEHFSGTEDECELYCKEHSIDSLAEWYIYPKNQYPMGYYIERNLPVKEYRLFINGEEKECR